MMTTTRKTYESLEEIKDAVKSGVAVRWKNSGHSVKEGSNGDFNVLCFNGYCAHLSNSYKAEEFYSL
jgi:hypothetical protein